MKINCINCHLRAEWEKSYKKIMDKHPNMAVQKLINEMRTEDQERLNCEHLEQSRGEYPYG